MKITDYDILNTIANEQFTNQRALADVSQYSLGKVNQALKILINEGYINCCGNIFSLTDKARYELKEKQPQNAIILAAGRGMRMAPIDKEIPKGLITVYGESLIERLITQLISAGVSDITVIVGFMKEQYDYLIDQFNVKLAVNMDYSSKNNLFSLSLLKEKINNTYILPCDIWCKTNPFSPNEWYSWYMVTEMTNNDSIMRATRNKGLTRVKNEGNAMIGISYLHGEESKKVRKKLEIYSADKQYEHAFWEETLYSTDSEIIVAARPVSSSDVFEINTYEQLREIDENSKPLKSDVIKTIAEVLCCKTEAIKDINVLKKGMTNRSFTFTYENKRYIMRIPGEGTDKLIDRKKEYAVYQAISLHKICDEMMYFNKDNGHKLTPYLENARVCDPLNTNEVKACMAKLRAFHQLRIKVAHTFDIFEQIEFYEKLWPLPVSCFKDYKATKANVMQLKEYLNSIEKEQSLTHIDAVHDNFLLIKCGYKEEIRLVDWEYAAMQDPHIDIAMFAVYSLYEKEQIDTLIDSYFDNQCPDTVRVKIYAYIAMCGFLWSNWCEYKRQLGVEFGEYALRQYRYAKDYHRIFTETYAKQKHTARKAIILAAGFGSRLCPVTDKTPKPLIEVNGKKMIETMLNGFVQNGITEVYVVTGHLKEQFAYLPQKYKSINLNLIENPYYETCNNISSLYIAREHLGDCIITDGDLLLYNAEILNPQFDNSGYCSIWAEETDEWLQTTDSEDNVLSCSRTGGKNGWQLLSISFWSKRDGAKLKYHLEETFEKNKNTSIYWDDIPMFHYKDEYRLKVRKIDCGDVIEIDTLQELSEVDISYKKLFRPLENSESSRGGIAKL